MSWRKLIIAMIFLTGVTARGGVLDSDKKVSFQLDNVPLGTVVKMLAGQYNLNIVQAGELNENVSVKLENVGLIDALKTILLSNGYYYYTAGDIIVVKSMESVAASEMAAREITLKYVSPAAVINAVSDMLSPKGKIKTVGDPATITPGTIAPQPTQVVIVDFPEIVEKVASFIATLDKPTAQVAIEVRMVEMNVSSSQKTGLAWPTSLTGRVHGITLQSDEGTTTSTTATEALGQIQLPDGKWEWGKLSVAELSVVLDFLDKSGNSKLISDPRITTLNNCPAEIKATTVVPIQTINRFSEAGSTQDIVTFQDEEIGITLLVTPHITEGNEIILEVNPTVAEIIGYSGTEANQKPITSERSVQTKISVKDGETAVLGGLLKESKIENRQKVFFLGSLPLIGGLFRHKTVENATTDLLILITPTIISK
jgi:type II secretory pathway component GspD/PulD (secretin)